MYINRTFSFLFIAIWTLLPGTSSSELVTVETSPTESSSPTSVVSKPATPVRRTQLFDAGKGKMLLLVRAKFSWTWKNTGPALEGVGLIVDDKDRRSGIYDIFYPAGGIANGQSNKQDRTLLERVGLTTGNAEQSHRHYQIKLKKGDTGGTLITVQDHEGLWQSSEVATEILTQLQKQLNTGRFPDKGLGDQLWALLPGTPSGEPVIVETSPTESVSSGNSSPTTVASVPAKTVRRAQLVDVGKGKILLLVRAKFSWTWRNTGRALEKIGLIIDDKDRRTGIYDIFYPASGISGKQSKEQDRTLLERIGLTTGDAEHSNLHYQIKLKKEESGGVRIMVLDHEGQWHRSKIAVHILTQLHKQLNTVAPPADSLGDQLLALLPGGLSSEPEMVKTSPTESVSSGNSRPTTVVSVPAKTVRRAQMVDVGKGKMLLLVRAKFSWTWRNTGRALEKIGLIIDDKDRRTGIYDIFYPASGISGKQSKEQDRTLLERIGLTTGDDEQSKLHYQIKLKKEESGGVRIMVLDHEGQWRRSKIAVHILTQLHKQLN